MSLTHKRLPTAENFDEYHRLFQDCFPETAGTPLQSPAHYQWKYGAGGKQLPAFEFAAYEDDQLLGYYAALPLAYRLGDFHENAALVCDVMTHSKARGKGVFTAQGRYATDYMGKNGIAFCTGYPIRSYVFPGHIKVGWGIAFPLPVYVKVLDLKPVLATKHLGLLGAMLRPLCSGAHHLARLTRSRFQGGSCRRVDPATFFQGTDYARFYEQWSQQGQNHLVRTAEFYRWRLTAPQSAYTVTALYHDDSQLAGLAITRNSTLHGFPITNIVDFLILPQYKSAAGALHDELARLSRETGTAGLVVMTTQSNAARWGLGRNGYFRSKIEFKLILKWLSSEAVPSTFWSESAWHLTWADTDNL